MKTRTLFITALQDIEISSDLDRGDKISDNLLITNNPSTIQSLVDSTFEISAGKLETSSILDSKAVIYSFADAEADFIAQERLTEYLRATKIFLTVLWLIKDNSVNSDLGYLSYQVPGGTKLDSNYVAVLYFSALGQRLSTKFDREELRTARKLFRTKMDVSNKRSDYKGSILKKGVARLSRAFYFLQGARSTSDLGLKIADYCTCFESLFSTSNYELAHQLSERVAVFIGDQPQERLEIFTGMKEAYDIRSRIVHGDVLKAGKIASLEKISQSCDAYLRKALLRIFIAPQIEDILAEDPKKLDDYFTNLIFGLPTKIE